MLLFLHLLLFRLVPCVPLPADIGRWDLELAMLVLFVHPLVETHCVVREAKCLDVGPDDEDDERGQGEKLEENEKGRVLRDVVWPELFLLIFHF